MTVDRRALLRTLGLGGAVGLAGCSLLDDGADTTDSTDETTPESEAASDRSFDARARIEASLAERASTRPELDFSYDPVDADVSGSDLFARVTARPATDARGDYLQFRPAARPAAELASLLRDLTNVGTASTVATTVGDATVELTGGVTAETAAFVGTASVDGPAVIAVRARDTATARSLAGRDPFPLSTE